MVTMNEFARQKSLLLLNQDVELPVQWQARFASPRKPEENLLWAIIDEALLCLQRYGHMQTPTACRLFTEARDWFLSGDASYPFSFVNVCGYLGLEADFMQAGIRRLLNNGMTPARAKWKRYIAGMDDSHRTNLSEALKRAWAEGRTRGKASKKGSSSQVGRDGE